MGMMGAAVGNNARVPRRACDVDIKGESTDDKHPPQKTHSEIVETLHNKRKSVYAMLVDNTKDIPPEISHPAAGAHFDDPSAVYQCRHFHHRTRSPFPLVPPDYFSSENYVPPSGQTIDKNGYFYIGNEDLSRKMYRDSMSPTLFRNGAKHYCPGTAYKVIESRFYVLPMSPPRREKGSGWIVDKVRLKVSILDENDDHEGYAYVETAHTPLIATGEVKQTRGLAYALKKNAQHHNPRKANDVRAGNNLGAMSAAGMRVYSSQIIQYRNTPVSAKELIKSAEAFLNKYKFGMWVRLLRSRMLEVGPSCFPPEILGRTSFCTLGVVTQNYGNEAHQDYHDECQGIAIWHSSHGFHPCGPRKKQQVQNWFFVFPDMMIMVNNKWHKGVAIQLYPGTVVSWDARLLRHCTAVPELVGDARAYGTYFGISTKVAKYAKRKEEERKAKLKQEARERPGRTAKRMRTEAEDD
jgi:hypothetical protein